MALQGNALLRTPIVALLRHGSHSSGSSPGGSLGAVAHKWAILAPTWLSWFQLRSNLGSMLGQLGPNFAQLGQSWRQLGASWAQLGTSLIPTWPILTSTSPNLTWEPVPRARWWHGQQALDKTIQKIYEFIGHRDPGLVGLVVFSKNKILFFIFRKRRVPRVPPLLWLKLVPLSRTWAILAPTWLS